MYDVIVVGGGIVGLSAAYHLAVGGANTLLIDRADYGRATDAGAGILSPEMSGLDLPDEWYDFALKAVDYYPTLLNMLNQDQQIDIAYAVCGVLLIPASEDEMAPFEQVKQRVFARQQRRGLSSSERLQVVSAERANALFSPLSALPGALYSHDGARVDSRSLMAGLRRAAESLELNIIEDSVTELLMDGQTVTGVVVNKETYQAGKVIVAGGAWSQVFGEQLEFALPIKPQRGQIIYLELPGMDPSNWPIVMALNGHYIVGWPGNRLVVGATHETDSGFNPYTTASGIHEVLAEALRMAPGLRDARIQETRAGLRPTAPDGLPVMGTVPGIDGIYVATGHGSTGLQLGPYSGKLAADWALGHESETDISAFAVSRFQDD
jgi:D-amino-acid dehydrogenase